MEIDDDDEDVILAIIELSNEAAIPLGGFDGGPDGGPEGGPDGGPEGGPLGRLNRKELVRLI